MRVADEFCQVNRNVARKLMRRKQRTNIVEVTVLTGCSITRWHEPRMCLAPLLLPHFSDLLSERLVHHTCGLSHRTTRHDCEPAPHLLCAGAYTSTGALSGILHHVLYHSATSACLSAAPGTTPQRSANSALYQSRFCCTRKQTATNNISLEVHYPCLSVLRTPYVPIRVLQHDASAFAPLLAAV
jgi:hypothetical protein